jgi:uncharacterized protein (DUF2336 family)
MHYDQHWVTDIEQAIRNGSRDKRVDSLRKVTALFLSSAEQFSENQIDVFDTVLLRLIERIETHALAELSQNLAPVSSAPNEVIQQLARNDEISVAGPVLKQSMRLTTNDLVEIARSKGQEHLFAITHRANLEIPVTDILIERGQGEVLGNLMKNKTAQISKEGFSNLLLKANESESLLAQIARRLNIPLERFRELLARATEAVREKLLALMQPGAQQQDIEQVLARATEEVVAQTARRDFAAAEKRITDLQKAGKFNEQALAGFLREKKYEDVVASIAAVTKLPADTIDGLMHAERGDGLLIPCKTMGLTWPTVKGILQGRPSWRVMSEGELEKTRNDYIQLSRDTAERIIRFWRVRATVGEGAGAA